MVAVICCGRLCGALRDMISGRWVEEKLGKKKRNRREGCENGLVTDIVMSPFFGIY